jgi:CRP-like cAMP-binding protein
MFRSRPPAADALREAAWVARCVGRADNAPLRPDDIAALGEYLQLRESPRGAVLFKQGETQPSVIVVRSGMVELSVGSGRRRLVVQILRAGDVEGDISLLLGQPPPYQATALDEVTCLELRASSFEPLLAQHPAIARRWLSSVAERLARSHMRIVELLGKPLVSQTAALLLDEAVDGEIRLPQQTLAAMLGVHRQGLNRVLKKFEADGLLALSYRGASLLEVPRLRRLAGR